MSLHLRHQAHFTWHNTWSKRHKAKDKRQKEKAEGGKQEPEEGGGKRMIEGDRMEGGGTEEEDGR